MNAAEQQLIALAWGMARIASPPLQRKEVRHASAVGHTGQAACEERQTTDAWTPAVAPLSPRRRAFSIPGGSCNPASDDLLRGCRYCGGRLRREPELEMSVCVRCRMEAQETSDED